MWEIIYTFLPCCLFVFLFFRQDVIDRAEALRRERAGDLHIMMEMKKFLEARGADSSFLDADIEALSKHH